MVNTQFNFFISKRNETPEAGPAGIVFGNYLMNYCTITSTKSFICKSYSFRYCTIVLLNTVLIQPDKQRVASCTEALLSRFGRYATVIRVLSVTMGGCTVVQKAACIYFSIGKTGS